MKHPLYKKTPYFDVAVVIPDKEISLVNKIRPICLPFQPTEQNTFPLIPSDDEEIDDNTPFTGKFWGALCSRNFQKFEVKATVWKIWII